MAAKKKATKKKATKKAATKKVAKKATKKKATKKAATKKAATKKTATKKAATKKTATKKTAKVTHTPTIKLSKLDKARTKSQLYSYISDHVGISKKEVVAVFDKLNEAIGFDLKRGSGVFNLPGLLKLKVVRKPATKARKGINPFTGEEMTFKAKPARNIVRARPLKALKEMV